MNIRVFNENNLKDGDIDEKVTRVKAFIINHHNEILMAKSGGGVQLIGGHVEKGEEMVETIQREVLEETGMLISIKEISSPFFEIIYYTKNYKDFGKNRLSNVFYYVIQTDKEPNLEKLQLTEHEKERGFTLEWVKTEAFEEFTKRYLNDKKEISRNVANEILIAFEELKQKNLLIGD